MKKFTIINFYIFFSFFSLGYTSKELVYFYHRVEKGDTLFSLAKKYQTHVNILKNLNQLKDTNIHLGTRVIIPTNTRAPYYYLIKKGDSFYSLSKKFEKIGIELSDIVEVNKIKDPYKIQVGQKIFIPKQYLKLIKKEQDLYPFPRFEKPIQGELTSNVGYRFHPRFKKMKFHSGVDIASPYGTKVFASFAGYVTFAGYKRGYGNLVIIKHKGNYKTYYGHLSKILVSKNQKLSKRQIIGKVGQSGIATGPHLHFEIRYYNKVIPILNQIANLKGQIGSYW